MTCTTYKCIIVIPWSVKDVTIDKAPPSFLTAYYREVGCMFTMSPITHLLLPLPHPLLKVVAGQGMDGVTAVVEHMDLR